MSEPAFWFGFEVAWAKLALGRVVVFGLLALDAVMQIRHAPRYGAGSFNVGHVLLLDGLGPTRGSYGVAELINAYLFVLAACGVATRVVVPIAAAIYAWLYFGSQLDSYQHHYLVALVLVLASFVPWQRPLAPTPVTAATPVRTWALRLILVQLGVMYLWAAISKLDPAWLDGRTLATQIGGPVRHLIDATVGIAFASKLVVVAELALAATVWLRPAWKFAAPLGLAFHLGIVFTGLEIGLFAWLMIGLYVFVVPDRIWIWIARVDPMRPVRAIRRRATATGAPPPWLAWSLVAACGVIAVVAAALTRFEHALVVAIALTLAGASAVAVRKLAGLPTRVAVLAAAHVFAIAGWLVADRASTLAFDYYRLWGGSSRRLGDVAAAEHAYRTLIAEFPDEPTGHYQLGRVLLAREATDPTAVTDGLAELHAAQRLEPGRARAFVAEARWLAAHHRRAEALDKARAAWSADPADKEANELITTLAPGAPGAPEAP